MRPQPTNQTACQPASHPFICLHARPLVIHHLSTGIGGGGGGGNNSVCTITIVSTTTTTINPSAADVDDDDCEIHDHDGNTFFLLLLQSGTSGIIIS